MTLQPRGPVLVAVLVGAGLAVAALLVSLLQPGRGPHPHASSSEGNPSGPGASELRSGHAANYPARPSLPPAGHIQLPAARGAADDQPEPPDPEEVRAALARFQRELGKISKEQIEAEQTRMTEFLEHARELEAPEPRVEPFRDEHGLLWNELTYPSGEVRYEFPSEGRVVK